MNSICDKDVPMSELVDDESTSIDDEMRDMDLNLHSTRTSLGRSSAGSTSSNGTTATTTTSNGVKRQKEMPPCFVCGAKANGYNFDQITCESCKAFFRRNALKSTDKFRCRNNDDCSITVATRKRCKRCRINKCFRVGMRKDWILTEEEKTIKRKKIEHNRMIKKQAQVVLNNQNNDVNQSNAMNTGFQTIPQSNSHVHQSLIIAIPSTHMYQAGEQQLFERQHLLLNQLSTGYQSLTRRYSQPNKFLYRNSIIAQTHNIDEKLDLIKDLTRELTQMTTLRLLHFFNLIPEFHSFSEQEKTSVLVQNMLAVFMFHGALTYNAENDTFVDRATEDQPYDAKYLLFVYGDRVYDTFIGLARRLTSVAYQSSQETCAEEDEHTLFLLLMVILLFSSDFQSHNAEHLQGTQSNFKEKLVRIQQHYVELACRFIHDRLGFAFGKKMFQKLVPLLRELQKLCSTLANVNLCEMAEEDDRSNSTTTTYHHDPYYRATPALTDVPSPEFDSTMISGRAHLNELQKENREPASSSFSSSANSTPLSSVTRTSPSALSNMSSSPSGTTPPNQYYSY